MNNQIETHSNQLQRVCFIVRALCWIVGGMILISLASHYFFNTLPPSSGIDVMIDASGDANFLYLPESQTGQLGDSVQMIPIAESDTWVAYLQFGILGDLMLIGLLCMLFQLERLFQQYQKQVYFGAGNHRRLKWVASILFVLVLLEPLQLYLVANWLPKFTNTPVLTELPNLSAMPESPASEMFVGHAAVMAIQINLPLLCISVALYFMALVLEKARLLKIDSDMTI